MNTKTFFDTAVTVAKKHSPEILTGIGIAGMITAIVTAVAATPKAISLIEEKKKEQKVESLSPIDTAKTVWVCYIPTTLTMALSIACIIGASKVNLKRNAALAAAYSLSETALKEYKDKVVEVVGEKKCEKIKDEIAKDKINAAPVSSKEIIITDKGQTLCYDILSGRYFKTDIDSVKKAENKLNQQMLTEGYVTLNDFYYELGIDNIKLGDDLGWSTDRTGLIKLEYSSQLASDGMPCLVIGHAVAPKYDF